jgi:hypothetical protein
MQESSVLVTSEGTPKAVKFSKVPALRRFSVLWTPTLSISTRFARHSPEASWWAVILTSCPLIRQSELQPCRWLEAGTSSPYTISACATSTRRSIWFRPSTKIQPFTAGTLAGGSAILPLNVPSTAKAVGVDSSSANARLTNQRSSLIIILMQSSETAFSALIVILKPKVGNERFAAQMAQRVFQLH